MRKWIHALSLLLTGCASNFAALQGSRENDVALQELRIEVSDLKHALHASEVEVQLLEDRVAAQEGHQDPAADLSTLRQKVALLEANQQKLSADLKQMATHVNQVATTAQEIQGKLDEIAQLKQVLSKIAAKTTKSYKVKPGDSLEKIAKAHHVSVESLKERNGLSSDRIAIGQTLELP